MSPLQHSIFKYWYPTNAAVYKVIGFLKYLKNVDKLFFFLEINTQIQRDVSHFKNEKYVNDKAHHITPTLFPTHTTYVSIPTSIPNLGRNILS